MAKIVQSDLSSMDGISQSYLESVSGQTLQIYNKLREFYSNSESQLKGAGYDAMRKIIDTYASAFLNLNGICSSLNEGINSANGKMAQLTEGMDLDDKDIPSIQNEINRINSTIRSLQNANDEYYDEQSQSYKRKSYAADIARYTAEVRKLEHKLGLLKNLQSNASTSAQSLESAKSNVNRFENKVNHLKNVMRFTK